jgi:hypothetical protein
MAPAAGGLFGVVTAVSAIRSEAKVHLSSSANVSAGGSCVAVAATGCHDRSVTSKLVRISEVEVPPALGLGFERADAMHEVRELEGLFGYLGEIEAWR